MRCLQENCLPDRKGTDLAIFGHCRLHKETGLLKKNLFLLMFLCLCQRYLGWCGIVDVKFAECVCLFSGHGIGLCYVFIQFFTTALGKSQYFEMAKIKFG